MFIGVSAHAYMSICVFNIFVKKRWLRNYCPAEFLPENGINNLQKSKIPIFIVGSTVHSFRRACSLLIEEE
jgi:hypothetical protein